MYSDHQVAQLIKEKGFRPTNDLDRIQSLNDANYLTSRFLLHDEVDRVNDVPTAQAHIVTGFGPTRAPTAGTLSVIFRAKGLANATGLDTTIIISNLGAWCSRQIPAQAIAAYTAHFLHFFEALDIALEPGIGVRTHENYDTLRLAGILPRLLSVGDLENHKEVTADLYGTLGLLGNSFGVWTDVAYTIADILEPLKFQGKRRVLVLAGLEEHYFVDLARIALRRCEVEFPTLFGSDDLHVAGLYARVLRGLNPYPKMSKSIAGSAIGLEDSDAELKRRIVDCPPEDDSIVRDMIVLASDWLASDVDLAQVAFDHRAEDPVRWAEWKARYLEYFVALKRMWQLSMPTRTWQATNTSLFST